MNFITTYQGKFRGKQFFALDLVKDIISSIVMEIFKLKQKHKI